MSRVRPLLWFAVVLVAAAGVLLVGITTDAIRKGIREGAAGDEWIQLRRQDEDRTVLDTDLSGGKRLVGRFVIANVSEGPVEVLLKGRSCGCTSIRVEGKPAEPSQSWLVDGEGTLDLEMEAPFETQASGLRSLQANFVAKQNGKEVGFVANWEVDVLAALAVSPTPVQIRLPGRTEEGKSGPVTTSCQIVHRRWPSREGPPAAEAPRLSRLPDGMQVVTVRHLRRDVRDRGLVEDVWNAELRSTEFDKLTPLAGNTLRALAQATSSDGSEIEKFWNILVLRPSGIMHPQTIDLGAIPVGEVIRRRMLLLSWDRSAFRVLEARTRSSQVKASVSDGGGPHRVWLEIEATPSEIGKVDADVTLLTDHPNDRELHIPCRFVGRYEATNAKSTRAK